MSTTNAATYACPSGLQTIRLPGATLIESVTITNQSNGAVSVFLTPGSSGTGNPDFVVQANTSITQPVNNLSTCTFTFSGSGGSVYVQVTDAALSAQSSVVASPSTSLEINVFGAFGFQYAGGSGEALALAPVAIADIAGNTCYACNLYPFYSPRIGARAYLRSFAVNGIPVYVRWGYYLTKTVPASGFAWTPVRVGPGESIGSAPFLLAQTYTIYKITDPASLWAIFQNVDSLATLNTATVFLSGYVQ